MEKCIYVANIQVEDIGQALGKGDKDQLKSSATVSQGKVYVARGKGCHRRQLQPKHQTYSKSHQ